MFLDNFLFNQTNNNWPKTPQNKTKPMLNKRFRVKVDEYYVLVYIYSVLPRKVTKDHQSSSLWVHSLCQGKA